MMKSAVVFDRWKYPVFYRHFNESDLDFDDLEKGPTPETRMFKVYSKFVKPVHDLAKAATEECEKNKKQLKREFRRSQ